MLGDYAGLTDMDERLCALRIPLRSIHQTNRTMTNTTAGLQMEKRIFLRAGNLSAVSDEPLPSTPRASLHIAAAVGSRARAISRKN